MSKMESTANSGSKFSLDVEFDLSSTPSNFGSTSIFCLTRPSKIAHNREVMNGGLSRQS